MLIKDQFGIKEGKSIETVVQTDWQDIYRLIPGVLVVVNKFKRTENTIGYHNYKDAPYNKHTQNLRILKEQFIAYDGTSYPKGTVFDGWSMLEHTDNPREYTYIIKTTGESFFGPWSGIEKYIDDLQDLHRTYYE